jgi:hypothetical protein
MRFPRVVNQDAPHHDRRKTDELRTVVPVDLPLIDQPHVRLVHERRRLQRVALPLPAQVAGGQSSQLGVDDWQDAVRSIFWEAVHASANV